MSDLSSLVIPAGFRFGATTAGLKASGRPDFALIVADEPASAAAMFTANQVSAAPLAVDKIHLEMTGGKVRVVLINAGNANCAAGQAGYDAARECCLAAARVFNCPPEQTFPSSTGIIGVPLPAEKLITKLPELSGTIDSTPEKFAEFAQAILTTDLVEKTAFARVEFAAEDGSENGTKCIHIAAACKGSGMIHPQLVPHATMLVYILTDAEISAKELNNLLQGSVNKSFNRISVDGDTSTNDTVLLLASGASGIEIMAANTAAYEQFAEALDNVCTSLARQIVADGEGVTHVVELNIQGAASDADALKIAKAIAHSPLVKTAWAGCDPNWGRLMAAIGYSGAKIDPNKIDIQFGQLPICHRGGRHPDYDPRAAHSYISQPEFTINIQLHLGEGSCTFWTTDLTHQYVSINADYST
jgi:glutamate N-acetyltransferase/amino-acid N-acetyltransferase